MIGRPKTLRFFSYYCFKITLIKYKYCIILSKIFLLLKIVICLRFWFFFYSGFICFTFVLDVFFFLFYTRVLFFYYYDIGCFFNAISLYYLRAVFNALNGRENLETHSKHTKSRDSPVLYFWCYWFSCHLKTLVFHIYILNKQLLN